MVRPLTRCRSERAPAAARTGYVLYMTIFSEEYHVVHHQAPGYHHTRYRAHYEKHRSKYDLVFEKCNLFELGFTAIFRNYERLRGFVKDPTPETIDILKRRLRCTWW